jgi:hypothetical protein
MRKTTLIVALAAALFFVGTGCDTIVTLDKPVVSAAALDTDKGGTLRLTWTAITDAKSYEITTDDSIYSTTSTSFDVSTPSATIEVRAVNGSDKSDPAIIDCKVVETSSVILYGISDTDPSHPSGLTFTASGAASAMSLEDANKASLDFVCDDQDANVLPVGLINAGSYGWSQNTKINTVMDAGTTDYDAFTLAAGTGYDAWHSVAFNGVYAFWLSSSMTWTSSDHFCKAKVISVEDISGTQKITINVAYQKIGGLRWLVK